MSVYQFAQTFNIHVADHVLVLRSPVRTDVQGRSSDAAVIRMSSIHDDEDLLPTTGCCFVRSRDAARLTLSSPGVAVSGAAAMYVGSVVSSDAISTARLLCESSGQGTCSLSASAAVNAACEPLLSAPSRCPRPPSDDDDDDEATRGVCVTTSTTSRRLRDSGIAFIDDDDRL